MIVCARIVFIIYKNILIICNFISYVKIIFSVIPAIIPLTVNICFISVARKMVLDLLQNGSGSVLKSRFRLSFKRWGLPVGL